MVHTVWLVILAVLVVLDIFKGKCLMSAISDLNDSIAAVGAQLVQTDAKVDLLVAQGANSVPQSEVVAATGAVSGLASQVQAINAKLDAAIVP